MSVLNNLVKTTTLSKHELVTIDRPVIIDYEYSSGDDIPVICEVQAWGNIKGLWTRIGSPLFANRIADSTSLNPKFELDFSDVIGRHLNDTFKRTMTVSGTSLIQFPPTANSEVNAFRSHKNNSTNPDAEGMTSVKFFAVAWCVGDDGVLVRSSEDSIPWNDDYYIQPIRLTLPPSFLSSITNFSNVIGTDGDIFKGLCNITDLTSGAKSRFSTGVPRGAFRRKIHKAHPVPLALIIYNQAGAINLTVSYNAIQATDGSALSANISLASSGTGNNFFTYLYDCSKMTALIGGGVSISDIKSDVDFKMNLTGAPAVDTLSFEVLEHSGAISSYKNHAKPIYWINDFNVLDYYLFDGGTTIEYENKTKTFVKNKDYSIRRDASRAVLKGESTELVTVLSTAMNRETLTWLQEIGRSRDVYEYDEISQTFIPIQIDDFKTKTLDTVSRDAHHIEISYKRDVISTR